MNTYPKKIVSRCLEDPLDAAAQCQEEENEEDDGAGSYECDECGSTYHPTSECSNTERSHTQEE